MSYNKYKIEEIEVGDQVYFDGTPSQSNFDEYWDVHGKSGDRLLVNLRREHYWSVEVKDVRQHIKMKKA